MPQPYSFHIPFVLLFLAFVVAFAVVNILRGKG